MHDGAALVPVRPTLPIARSVRFTMPARHSPGARDQVSCYCVSIIPTLSDGPTVRETSSFVESDSLRPLHCAARFRRNATAPTCATATQAESRVTSEASSGVRPSCWVWTSTVKSSEMEPRLTETQTGNDSVKTGRINAGGGRRELTALRRVSISGGGCPCAVAQTLRCAWRKPQSVSGTLVSLVVGRFPPVSMRRP
jgi:hypothetical protein